MDLSDDQKQKVAQWINEGVGLSDVQTRLQEEFSVSMTFMEVRFLVDDLDLDLQDDAPAEPEPEPEASASADEPIPFSGEADEASVPQESGPLQDAVLEDEAGGFSNVKLSVDKLQRPGAVVSGDVTFTDGVTANWQIDQMGRLGLIPSQEGYQPSQEDIVAFQEALQNELQKQGF